LGFSKSKQKVPHSPLDLRAFLWYSEGAMEDTTKKIVEKVKRTIRRRLKIFEIEKGISVSLKIKKEKWDFICELAKELDSYTLYPHKGYTITSQILLPTPSRKALNITFHISYYGYSVPYPVFDWYWTQHLKEPILLIKPSFSLNSAKDKYYKFLRKMGLVKGNDYLTEIKFKLDESEYKLVEYIV
jgi:hypothetical protein